METILNIDKSVVMFFQNMHTPMLDKFFAFITTLGNLGIIWVVISLILMCTKRFRKAGVISLLALAIGGLLGEAILKNVIQRSRPFLVMEGINTVIKYPITYSFPSGHATSSFTAMLSVVKYSDCKYIRLGMIVLAPLVIVSRLYLGVHFLSDILAGLLLGYITYRIASWIGETYIFKDKLA